MPLSKHEVPGRVRTIYEFIKAHREQYSVQMLCRVLEVAPSGYYEWRQQPLSNRAIEDARLLRLIRASFTASKGIYGAPRVFLDLREAGETCSKHRVARLMRQAKLRALHGYRTRRWTVGKPSVLIPNLLKRQFTMTKPNRVGDGYHLHSHVARLALPRCRDGSVLTQDRGLGGHADHSSRVGA
jgi:putative transposase